VRLKSEDPPVDGTIDGLFALPPIADEGILRATAFLPLESVGIPADPEVEPPALQAGERLPHAIHPAAIPQDCIVEPGPGEVCVPGGAFWMGNANETEPLLPEESREHVVAVSSFLVDAKEVTVAQMRMSRLGSPGDPIASNGTPDGCTFTPSPDDNDALPVTCTSRALAERYCAKYGKSLLTEAQFEFLASGRRSLRYVWGSDAPLCSDVVHARQSPAHPQYIPGLNDTCAALGFGPARAGSGMRDALDLPAGRVLDVAGNVREWTRDRYEPLSAASCWSQGFLVDPFCAPRVAGELGVVRGTSWSTAPMPALAVYRANAAPNGDRDTGFRCARPGH
jgi:formylglycine-generating enzyme required for sulfatase activity